MLSPGLCALCSVASVAFGSIPGFLGRMLQVPAHPVAFSDPFQDSVPSPVQMLGPMAVSAPVPWRWGCRVVASGC